jgi:Zn/Cd-binding protein ZinT
MTLASTCSCRPLPTEAITLLFLLQNAHINELMKKHERSFAEIKNYYNDITHNNLDLIKALKEDVAEMKKREAQNEKLMYVGLA